MTRSKIIAAAVAVITVVGASAASAQVVAYHHRSTAFGDYMAGYGEAVLAEGISNRNHAIAYRTYIQAERERAALNYELVQGRLYLKEQRKEAFRQKVENRRERQQQQSVAQDAAALQLLTDVQRDLHVWTTALQRPEFAQSMKMVGNVLKGWTPDGTSADNAYRKALMTEAGALKKRIAANSEIRYLDRLRAVKELDKITRLAKMETVDFANAAIAMR